MIDLRAYYLKYSTGYYNTFNKIIYSAPKYEFYDSIEIIESFRNICKPDNEADYDLQNDQFIMLCFWLYKNGYSILEFPNILSRPKSLRSFAYDDIRSYIMKRDSHSGRVPWSDRRELCKSIQIKSSGKFQHTPDEIEDKIRLISTRSADFDVMAPDERLATLNTLIENLLKRDGKYTPLDYGDVFYGYLTEAQIINYRKKTHCFRHASAEALNERKLFSDSEKFFLVELGIFITVHIHRHLLPH